MADEADRILRRESLHRRAEILLWIVAGVGVAAAVWLPEIIGGR